MLVPLWDDFGWTFFDNALRNVQKRLSRAELLPHVILTGSQCHTAAAEGAKLSTICIYIYGRIDS